MLWYVEMAARLHPWDTRTTRAERNSGGDYRHKHVVGEISLEGFCVNKFTAL